MVAEPAGSAVFVYLSALCDGLCCRRRAAAEPAPPVYSPVTSVVLTTAGRWRRLGRGLLRLAFIRRKWGHLGQWLQAVKARSLGGDHHLLR